ncbi:hypothetical protein GCM10028791_40280 [Echinicola sediminis]
MRSQRKKILVLFFVFYSAFLVASAQVQFVQRVEVPTEWDDHDYIVLPTEEGTISFRTKSERGFGAQQRMQYFTTDRQLNASEVFEFPVEDFFNLAGFDLDGELLYLLFQKGESFSSEKIVYEIEIGSQRLRTVEMENVLDMELQEFLVMDKKAVIMGTMDYRPVIQVFDTETKNIITVQGVYQNEVSILQIRKDAQLKIFDVLLSKRDRFKQRSVGILTFDTEGNKLREVKVEPDERRNLEIVEGVLTPIQEYKQVLIGPYGERRREPNKGIYLSKINEFGEYRNAYYGLEDFKNFYNYLPERQRERRERLLERAVEKEKNITIPNTLVTREVVTGNDYFLVYNDYYMISSGRFSPRDLMYSSDFYRYAPLSMRNRVIASGYPYYYSGMSGPIQSNEYKFMAAQFVLLDQEGNMVWDNSLSLEDITTLDPGKFGEVSFDGQSLFYLYLEEDKLRFSHIMDGEIVQSNEEIELALINEEERIKENQDESLSLRWWYDDYFLLTGKQKVRFLDEEGKQDTREVFFMTKIRAYESELPILE